jgi:hypothetical protein
MRGRIHVRRLTGGVVAVAATGMMMLVPAAAAETLFVAEPFTPPHAFTPGIEGPACDRGGAVFAVNYERQGTIGRVAPDGTAEVFLALLTPAGEIVREIDVLGARPSNICFGGPDGRTVYVTEVEHGRLVQYRTDRPGFAYERITKAVPLR